MKSVAKSITDNDMEAVGFPNLINKLSNAFLQAICKSFERANKKVNKLTTNPYRILRKEKYNG